jgi:hypothetical protein
LVLAPQQDMLTSESAVSLATDRSAAQGATPSPSNAARRAQLEAVFASIDANGDGQLSAAEVIKAVRANPLVARMLGLDHVRQEDGSRDAFERQFQEIDKDHNRKIDLSEFVAYFLNRELPTLSPPMTQRGQPMAILE